MAESVDASVSNTDRETCAGSTPARSTKFTLWRKLKSDFFVLVERVYKYMGWWKLISRGLCVKWCCFFCFSFAKWEFEWLSSGYAIRELLRVRICAHAFPEFFIFCCHKCHRGGLQNSFYSVSFMRELLSSNEKNAWLVGVKWWNFACWTDVFIFLYRLLFLVVPYFIEI